MAGDPWGSRDGSIAAMPQFSGLSALNSVSGAGEFDGRVEPPCLFSLGSRYWVPIVLPAEYKIRMCRWLVRFQKQHNDPFPFLRQSIHLVRTTCLKPQRV